MIVSHVGYVQFVIVTVTPSGFSTFFCVSVETHVTEYDVRVAWQMNCTIMHHSLHKSTVVSGFLVPNAHCTLQSLT